MWHAVSLVSAVAVCVPFSSQAAPALPCTAVGNGDAVMQWKGKRLPLPASLDDCRGARVDRGQVIACTSDARGLPLCRTFGKGEAIESRGFDAGGRGATVAGLDRVLRLQDTRASIEANPLRYNLIRHDFSAVHV